jgi:adenine-specific DNA methylase
LRAFSALISKAKAKHIIVSYSSEGIMSEAEIHYVLGRKGEKPELIPIDYRRFKSNSNGKLRNKKTVPIPSPIIRGLVFVAFDE